MNILMDIHTGRKKIDGIVQEDRQLYILAVLKNIGLKE